MIKALILMYHRVAEPATDPWSLSVAPRHFEEHLQVLQRFANPVRVRELSASLKNGATAELPRVCVTFDDGYSDNFYCANRLLERYDVPATVFLATGYLGSEREYWWDELDHLFLQPGPLPSTLNLVLNSEALSWNLGDAANYDETAFQRHRGWKAEQDPPTTRQTLYRSVWQAMQRMGDDGQQKVLDELARWSGVDLTCRLACRPMTPDEVRTLSKGGLIELGAHTETHPVLSLLSRDSQREEIQRSKTRVEDLVGSPISSFAYPYGDYNEESVAILRENRFDSACSTLPGLVQSDTHPFRLPRVHIGDWGGEELESRLTTWLEK